MGANVYLAWAESQTIDEAVHLTAGYSHLTTRDFRFNPEHPPLLKEISALPLLALDVKNVKDLSSWQTGDEWQAGKEFVYSSPASPKAILFTARMLPIIISLVLGLLVFTLAAYFTNRNFGLLAFGLYCLDPNIIAHSHLVTTDIAAALGFLGTLAALFYYANHPSLKRLMLVGLCLGAALSLKFSTTLLLLFVVLILAFSIFYFDKPKLEPVKLFWLLVKRFLLIGLIALLVVWLTYGFEVTKPSSSVAMAGDLAKSNPLFNRLQDWPIPFYSYLRGLGRVLIHSQDSDSLTPVYLLGNYSGGSWYYFFVAMIIKTPLVIMLGALAALIGGCKQIYLIAKKRLKISKKTFYIGCLGLFIITYLISSMFVAINIGWRHVLPIYPVLYILMAIAWWWLAGKLPLKHFKTASLIGATWLLLAISLAIHWPYTLSYANEALPIVNHKTNWPLLTDSNLDWGQDVYRLIDYAKQQPNTFFYYELFTNADIDAIGAPSNLHPADSLFDSSACQLAIDGRLVASYQVIYNDETDNFACLRGVKPDATVGSSILIFNR